MLYLYLAIFVSALRCNISLKVHHKYIMRKVDKIYVDRKNLFVQDYTCLQ